MDDFEEEFEEPEVVKPTPAPKPDLTVVSNPANQTINKGKSTVMQMNT